jgi:hypothetical protein
LTASDVSVKTVSAANVHDSSNFVTDAVNTSIVRWYGEFSKILQFTCNWHEMFHSIFDSIVLDAAYNLNSRTFADNLGLILIQAVVVGFII